nr:MAG TPA: hypothetical protein [Crassvirales sp.]
MSTTDNICYNISCNIRFYDLTISSISTTKTIKTIKLWLFPRRGWI